MNKTILAIASASALGVIAFLLVQFSNVEIKDGGVNVNFGTTTAEAGCYEDGLKCLPPIDFTDENGVTWTPEMLAGKVVVVNFWATWCRPCQHEIPALAEVASEYKSSVVILGILTDKPDAAKLKSFQERTGLTYPVVRVNSFLFEAFEYPQKLPTNFIYDRSGHLAFNEAGAITASRLEAEIKNLL